jgi:hypothetical protein
MDHLYICIGGKTYILLLHQFTLQDRCLDWFPRLRAISLAVEDVEAEQNEWRTLQAQVIFNTESYILDCGGRGD